MKILLLAFSVCLLLGCQQKETTAIVPSEEDNWAFPYFDKVDSINPILKPAPHLKFKDPITGDTVRWEERNVLNPTAIVKDDKVYLFYRAQDSMGTSRIGMAISTDGLHFEKSASPVFYPDNDAMKTKEWNYKKDTAEQTNSEECYFCYFDGVEDPRIVENEAGTYFMTYTSYDGKTARLSIASSKDLMSWTKHGLVMKGEKYADTWSKAGAIVGVLEGNRVIAKKLTVSFGCILGTLLSF